jgi:diguanylate cyclase (GGDEF)-like protein
LLLAGLRPEQARRLERAFAGESAVIAVDRDETLSSEMLRTADAIFFDFHDGDYIAKRIAHLMAESGSTGADLLYLADHPPSPDALALLPSLRPIKMPIEPSYLRGMLDASAKTRARIRLLDAEQGRIKFLYELSSSLLKVRDRPHVRLAMDRVMPGFAEASMILLSFPANPTPVQYFFSRDRMGPAVRAMLADHLRNAWDVLRPESPAKWDWVEQLVEGGGGGAVIDATQLTPNSFTSVPITRGAQTDGFLTVLPVSGREIDESFLQTAFLIGDLLSVLVYNLHLKEELERRATIDGLTGIFNRQSLFEQLERECLRSQRYDHPVTVVMLDLDRFKSINDTYTHAGGDEALRYTARTMKASLREVDFVGRCGGEEFIAVLPNTGLEGGRIWAERLRRSLMDGVVRSGDDEFGITASLGVASVSGRNAQADHVVSMADRALYKAKETGRNRVVVARDNETFFNYEGQRLPTT